MDNVISESFELDTRILHAITDMGFKELTPIQIKSIPAQVKGRDLIGQAKTGTGKTAAFGIPLLQKINPEVRKLQSVILVPTRELAIQVSEELKKIAKYMEGIRILPVYGGADIREQIIKLKKGVQIVVGTPGRIMDHMRRGTIKFDAVGTVIMDEADEMLDMGFLEDMETILSELPKERQTLLFSATMSEAVMKIAGRFQKDPLIIKVGSKELTVPEISQFYYEMRPQAKAEAMCRLIDVYDLKRSIAFCNTKKRVDELVAELQGRGYFAEGIHGDLKQIQRDRVMDSFRNGTIQILVATDVAARGIDVDDVEAVFNYDIPLDEEYYVHRIGRTGRAGHTGYAFNFVVGREIYRLKDIQRYCRTRISAQTVPSFKEVREKRAGKIMDQAGEIIDNKDIKDMLPLIREMIDKEHYSGTDIAAALLKMAMNKQA